MSVFPPCVAHLVCPIPMFVFCIWSLSFSKSCKESSVFVDACFLILTVLVVLLFWIVAMPAES